MLNGLCSVCGLGIMVVLREGVGRAGVVVIRRVQPQSVLGSLGPKRVWPARTKASKAGGCNSNPRSFHSVLLSILVAVSLVSTAIGFAEADRYPIPFPHSPLVSTMASSQPPKGRDNLLSALDVLIQALNLAKDACGVPPAQIAFASASVLLTMIRVPSPIL